MAKTTINNGDAGSTARAAINNNFTEVYTGQHTHNAAAKTTPVDADEAGLIDSAASNVLKKITWANIKAALKTYFDGLYPSVNASPVAGSGILQGYTSSGASSTSATVIGDTNGGGSDGDTVTLTLDGTGYTITQDGMGGDTGGTYSVDDSAHIAAALAALSGASVVDLGSGQFLATSPSAGAGSTASLSASNGAGNVIETADGVSPGSDAVPPSGDISSVTIITGIAGISHAPIVLLAQSLAGSGLAGVTVDVRWATSGVVFAALDMSAGTAVKTLADLVPGTDLSQSQASNSIEAVINGTPPIGGSVSVMVVAIPH